MQNDTLNWKSVDVAIIEWLPAKVQDVFMPEEALVLKVAAV